ncbi:hypothetical protein K9M79_02835 [Candidatus Woesearchaeota archaeon]|nr:hypothetical protein [Candidatus Woesearchaeota archaeon]
MAGESEFPKSDGDVLYASEVNYWNTSISNTTGKVRGISSTYFDSLDGSNLTTISINVAGKASLSAGSGTNELQEITVGADLSGQKLYFYGYVSNGDYSGTTLKLSIQVNDVEKDYISAGQNSSAEEFMLETSTLTTNDTVQIKIIRSGSCSGSYKYCLLGVSPSSVGGIS